MLTGSPASGPATACGRITAVESIPVRAGKRNHLFVVVRTDAGLDGVGEATLEWHDSTVQAMLSRLADIVVGQDAGRIEHCWQLMYRAAFWRGGPAHLSALAGIDQALWDIKGKAAGMPVYDLLGGRCRDVVPCYFNGPFGESPAQYVASAVDLVEQGYRALKVAPVPPTRPLDTCEPLRAAAAIVAAIREAIGPEVALAIDAHGRLSPAMAIRFAKLVEPNDIWFLEEPMLPDNVGALPRIAAATSIPIAAGERWFTRQAFRRALDLGGLALMQPDVVQCGGVSEMRRIAAMGELEQVGFAPHNPRGPVGTIIAAHVAIATPNFVTLERTTTVDEFIRTRTRTIGGAIVLSDAPGFGIELDLDACAASPAEAVPLPGWRHPDGGFAEW